MKLKVTILFKDEKEPQEFTCTKIQQRHDAFAMEIGLWRPYGMDEIEWFQVEPRDEG